MNKQETAEAIKVMQAYVDGTEIECKTGMDEWLSGVEPAWDFLHGQYRIKPKPREFWIDTVATEHSHLKAFEQEPDRSDNWPYIKVREVLE